MLIFQDGCGQGSQVISVVVIGDDDRHQGFIGQRIVNPIPGGHVIGNRPRLLVDSFADGPPGL